MGRMWDEPRLLGACMSRMSRHDTDEPLTALIDMIKFAVESPVRTAGGSDVDVDRVATAAAYAAWCWGSAAVFEGVPPSCGAKLIS
jgi:hypothetical protein